MGRVLRKLWSWCAATKHQLPDDICVERSVHILVVVDQGDELCPERGQLRLDGGQAGWYLFEFELRFGIKDEHLEVLLHTILCTRTKYERQKQQVKIKMRNMFLPFCNFLGIN